MAKVKKPKILVADLLKNINYGLLDNYKPSPFAVNYMNFVKMVNSGSDDIQTSPNLHYKMADSLTTRRNHIANLCFRGSGKALGFGSNILTPLGLTPIEDLVVGDTVYDITGAKTRVTYVSETFHKPMYEIVLSDGNTLKVSEDHINIIEYKSSNNKFVRKDLTTKELLDKGIYFNRKVSDRNPSGKEVKFFIPLVEDVVQFDTQEVPIDPYTLGMLLGDGSFNPTTGQPRLTSHKDDIQEILDYIPYANTGIKFDKRSANCVYTNFKNIGELIKTELGTPKHLDKYIPSLYLYNSKEIRLEVLRGLMDSDGYINKTGNHTSFTSCSKALACGVSHLVKSLGGYVRVVKKENGYKGFYNVYFCLTKDNPFKLKRKADLWYPNRKYSTGSRVGIQSIEPIEDMPSRCIAVDSDTHSYLVEGVIPTHNTTILAEMLILYLAIFQSIPNLGKVDVIMYISDSMENGAKSLRDNIEARYNNSAFLKKYLPKVKFTDNELKFTNIEGKKTWCKLFGVKTGVRGFKRNGNRPQLAILDDLISDDDANSQLILDKIKDVIYAGINNAMHPIHKKVVYSGTPFNKNDPLYEAIESGQWESNVYPICDKFPCSKKDFRGAWEERFSYERVKHEYDLAVAVGRGKSFNQELMLQIASDEDRMIQDGDIKWYRRNELLENKHKYNFYVTSDFATSINRKADYTVIGVWAVDSHQRRYLVDGVLSRQTMDKTFDDIFRFVKEYKPMSVGIEATGQQGGFISLLRSEMMRRNTYFNIAKAIGSTRDGVAVKTNKMDRFRLTVPFFKNSRVFIAKEIQQEDLGVELLNELQSVTIDGIKSVHDDALDMVSQLDQIYIVYPSANSSQSQNNRNNLNDFNYYDDMQGDLVDNYDYSNSYLV